MARRSEAPETSQEILRRLTRFSARVLDAPIAQVAITAGACLPSASVGLCSSLAKHRSFSAFAGRVRRARAHGGIVESIGSGLSAAGAR